MGERVGHPGEVKQQGPGQKDENERKVTGSMGEREATGHSVGGREPCWGWFSELAWGCAAGEVDVYMQISK